jgi:hypothetical protein
MSSKQKQKRPQEEEDPEVDADETPMPKPSKQKSEKSGVPPKKKKKPDPEPEPEEEPDAVEEDEEAEQEVSPEEADRLRKLLTKKRKKAKLVGYRNLSQTAGYINTGSENNMNVESGDCIHSLLSIADSKRLMRFLPTTPGAAGFPTAEFNKRLELSKASVPSSAARVTQAYGDAIFRQAMNDAVMRSVESGKKTVSASTMASVLRKYSRNLDLTAVVPPIGLVRHAQDIGIMNNPEADVEARKEEKKDQAAAKKAYADYMEEEEKRKQANRAKKAKSAEANATDRQAISAA